MKSFLAVTGFLMASFGVASAASIFWSFQNSPDGASGSANYNGPTNANLSGGTTTSVSGFQGTPDFIAIRGSGNLSVGTFQGGADFTDPSTGILWQGNGSPSSDGIGQAVQWGSGTSISTNAGAGFILSLNTVGVTDLALRFDVRSAISGSATGAITGFSSVSYRTSSSDPWTVLSATTPTWALQSAYTLNHTIDLTAFDELEGVETLELQFIFNGGAKPNSGTVEAPTYATHNMRIDNLLVTAVPEPGALGLAVLGLTTVAGRRRR